MLSKTKMNSHVYGQYNGILRYVETHSGYNEKCVLYRDVLPHTHTQPWIKVKNVTHTVLAQLPSAPLNMADLFISSAVVYGL